MYATRVDLLLHRRQQLTEILKEGPYSLVTYLDRAVVYSELAYPDLAAGDAYHALLLTDEVFNEGSEYYNRAREALQGLSLDRLPTVLNHGLLSSLSPNFILDHPDDVPAQVAKLASVRAFQMLSLNLLLCGCLKSASGFCERGISLAPANNDLLETKLYIREIAAQRLRRRDFTAADLSDAGLVRREVYPWNTHEPVRLSQESLESLNCALTHSDPRCSVRVSQLPILSEGVTTEDEHDVVSTRKQLGLFATQDVGPGETVLDEYSLVTANSRLKEPMCDACGRTDFPVLESDSPIFSCDQCHDTIFCKESCHDRAQELYHPSVCKKDVDSISKTGGGVARDDETLYLFLLARILAMSIHQDIHPLEVMQIKYLQGEFVASSSNDVGLSSTEPPPQWTLPFSFKDNIETPLRILDRMDIDVYTTLENYDIWVLNTLYSKVRGAAWARKNPKDGRQDVAAVYPLCSLANHDCEPNTTWEWAGRMVLRARDEGAVGGGRLGGLKAGEEVLNHCCDANLPVEHRRELALGDWAMCHRCSKESAGGTDSNSMVMDWLSQIEEET